MGANAAHANVFIRSFSARGELGGLSHATRAAVDAFDACGFDRVVVETVGTGQSETRIVALADTRVVVCPPGLGDDVQAIKAGTLEIADVLAVSKGDLPLAEQTAREMREMLTLRRRAASGEWAPRVVVVSALARAAASTSCSARSTPIAPRPASAGVLVRASRSESCRRPRRQSRRMRPMPTHGATGSPAWSRTTPSARRSASVSRRRPGSRRGRADGRLASPQLQRRLPRRRDLRPRRHGVRPGVELARSGRRRDRRPHHVPVGGRRRRHAASPARSRCSAAGASASTGSTSSGARRTAARHRSRASPARSTSRADRTPHRGIHPRVLSRSLSSERQHGVKFFLKSLHRFVPPRRPAAAIASVQTTFPRLLLDHAAARPNAPALREKEFGIWQTLSWSALAALVEALAGGLAEAGLKRGQHLVVIGENRPRLYASMLAAQSLGAIPVPLYQDAAAAEFSLPIANAEVAFASSRTRSRSTSCSRSAPGARSSRASGTTTRAACATTASRASPRSMPWREAGRAFAAAHPGFFARRGRADQAATTSRRCSSPRERPAMPRASSTPTTR